ncbi:hypothetical protein [Vibrio caribbeanicus]|uniref:hypothetical protein n=1 Tax=Vibrio caribbeanicus TaxID=701175 RepID=UPI002283ABE7|nr:hypothetical protein [Vibrio caribbeanicus]MCY9843956.1 hypothetical protein [Vibrio caribbeanicus]
MKQLILSILVIFSSGVFAGQTITTGIPTGVGSWEKNGKAVFAVYFSKEDINTVACNTMRRYLVTSDNRAYDSITSVLLTHYAARKKIVVYGTSACDDNPNGNSETLKWVCTEGNPC